MGDGEWVPTPRFSFNLMERTMWKIAVALIAGVVVGSFAMQTIHAQAGKKTYMVTEFSTPPDVAKTRPTIKAAGGTPLGNATAVATAVDGTAPKYVGIIEWPNAEAAVKWAKSGDSPKVERRYLVEAQ